MKSILFVCLGNICRSPIAEGVARRLAEQGGHYITVDSAGTGHWHVGEAPCTNSIEVAHNHGVDISRLRARQIKKADFSAFDLIVALDQSNYHDLKAMGCKNLVKLGDYGFEGADVPDPYFFKGFEGFENVYAMIESCVNNLLMDPRVKTSARAVSVKTKVPLAKRCFLEPEDDRFRHSREGGNPAKKN